MEALDNYYSKKIFIENKQSIFDEIVHACVCLAAKRTTFKQIYLLTNLSTMFIYCAFAFVYIMYGLRWLGIWNLSYAVIIMLMMRYSRRMLFDTAVVVFTYILNQIWLGVLLYNLGFDSGLWFFNIFMMYFGAMVTLENIRSSKYILAFQAIGLMCLYYFDVFVWSAQRHLDSDFVKVVFIMSFLFGLGIFLFLSMVCNIQDVAVLEKSEEQMNEFLENSSKSRFGLVYKKHFIGHLSLLLSKQQKTSDTTHFVLVDFSYDTQDKNLRALDNLKTKVDMFVVQNLKLYFPDTSFISHWNEHQYMFVMFDKQSSHVFSIMQIFLRECRKTLQNSLFSDLKNLKCACACLAFGDFADINLKQAIYETEKFLNISKSYDSDSIFVANYTEEIKYDATAI